MYENLIASCTCLMWTAAEFLRAGGHFSIGRAVRKKRGDNRDYWSTRTGASHLIFPVKFFTMQLSKKVNSKE